MWRSVLRRLGRMRFVRFGIRDRIIRFFDNPKNSNPTVFDIPFYGTRYSGNFNTFIDWSVYYYGAYSEYELQLIRDIAFFQHATFIDIGANVGHHTLFASTLFDNVIAVEPFAPVYNKIKQKIAINHLDNVRLIPYGFALENDKRQFFPSETENTGTGSFVRERQASAPMELLVRNGDEVLKEENIQGPAFIKIDTEGFEPIVLQGINQFISEVKPILFFEWTQNEVKVDNQNEKDQLLPPEYKCFEFVCHIPMLFFFERKSYRLKPISGKWPDGMILAIHQDMFKAKDFASFIQSKQVLA